MLLSVLLRDLGFGTASTAGGLTRHSSDIEPTVVRAVGSRLGYAAAIDCLA